MSRDIVAYSLPRNYPVKLLCLFSFLYLDNIIIPSGCLQPKPRIWLSAYNIRWNWNGNGSAWAGKWDRQKKSITIHRLRWMIVTDRVTFLRIFIYGSNEKFYSKSHFECNSPKGRPTTAITDAKHMHIGIAKIHPCSLEGPLHIATKSPRPSRDYQQKLKP